MDLDPFLLQDAFRADDPDDYIAGTPAHPHRGFETVTYLLNGRMRHRDNAGNEGVIEPGGIQWMTAGRGMVHSEIPASDQSQVNLARDQLAVLSKGEKVIVQNEAQKSRFLLVAARPLNESIARAGPFVMNTEVELRQAFSDYQRGEF